MHASGRANCNGNGSPGPGRAPTKRSRWPLLVVALLAGHVMILLTVVIVATRDPSFAVMPNYYENAVSWDQSQAQKRASAKLGWRLAITPAEEEDAQGKRAVRFALTDASGGPIAAASLDVTCFHHSYATTPLAFTAVTGPDGTVTQVVTVRHAGFWDFQCKAVAADGQVYTETVTQFVNPALSRGRVAKGLP